MKTTPFLTTPLALAFSLAGLFPAPAQEAPAKTQRIATIEMKSGTLGDLVDLLRRETAQSILLPGEFRILPLPEVVLRNVDAVSALQAVDQLVPEMLVNVLADQEGNPIIYITSGLPPVPPIRKVTRVFKTSSREALKPEELDRFIMNVISVSQLACQVNAEVQGRSNAKPPVIQAHSGTGLLIVAGDEEDVQLTGQIIAGLGGEALPFGKSGGQTSGLRVDGDAMTFDSKDINAQWQPRDGQRPPAVDNPTDPTSSREMKQVQVVQDAMKKYFKEKADALKIREENLKKQQEADSARPPTAK